jgi:hypothetical protein
MEKKRLEAQICQNLDERIVATFCRESEKPEKTINFDKKIYKKCNSYETHQIWRQMTQRRRSQSI